MMKVNVDYADKEHEIEMYKKVTWDFEDIKINKVLNKKDILAIQKLIKDIFVSDNIFEYIWEIVEATRNNKIESVSKYLEYGVSPRAWISLVNAARVVALLDKRTFVIPEDIKKVAKSVLTHRLVLNYEAIADWVTGESIIDEILNNVKVV
jgi:MoxR-like ATPase